MTLTQFLLIANIPTAISTIGVGILAANYKAKQPLIRVLGFLLIVWITSAICTLTLPWIGVGVNYIGSVTSLIDFPVIILLYHRSLDRKVTLASMLPCIVFLAFALVNLIFIQQGGINSYSLLLKSVILLIYGLYYFYWLLKELPTTQLHLLPMFWVNSAFIIYFSGNLFLYAFTHYLVNQLKNDLSIYWILHNAFFTLTVLMIAFALWVDLKNIKLHSL